MSITSISGNFLVIYVVFSVERLQTPRHWLLAALAASDLLAGVVSQPLYATYIAFFSNSENCFIEMAIVFMSATSCATSLLIICAIARDRLLTMSKRMEYNQHTSNKQIIRIVAGCWTTGSVVAATFMMTDGMEEAIGFATFAFIQIVSFTYIIVVYSKIRNLLNGHFKRKRQQMDHEVLKRKIIVRENKNPVKLSDSPEQQSNVCQRMPEKAHVDQKKRQQENVKGQDGGGRHVPPGCLVQTLQTNQHKKAHENQKVRARELNRPCENMVVQISLQSSQAQISEKDLQSTAVPQNFPSTSKAETPQELLEVLPRRQSYSFEYSAQISGVNPKKISPGNSRGQAKQPDFSYEGSAQPSSINQKTLLQKNVTRRASMNQMRRLSLRHAVITRSYTKETGTHQANNLEHKSMIRSPWPIPASVKTAIDQASQKQTNIHQARPTVQENTLTLSPIRQRKISERSKKKSTTQGNELSLEAQRVETNLAKEESHVKTMLIVLLLYTTGWLPFLIVMITGLIFRTVTDEHHSVADYFVWSAVLTFFNGAVNPFVYAFRYEKLGKEMKKAFKKVLPKFFRTRSENETLDCRPLVKNKSSYFKLSSLRKAARVFPAQAK